MPNVLLISWQEAPQLFISAASLRAIALLAK
jgi:hypothetical protein